MFNSQYSTGDFVRFRIKKGETLTNLSFFNQKKYNLPFIYFFGISRRSMIVMVSVICVIQFNLNLLNIV